MLPLYTNCIPAADMGYYDLSLTYITIATSFLFFDIWIAILRYMYDGRTVDEQATSIKSGLVIFSISSFIYLILGGIFAVIFHPAAIQWILIYGLFQNITNLLCFCVRGYQKNKEFAISGIISTLVCIVCNLIFILALGIGYESLFISAIIGFVAQSIYLLFFGNIWKLLAHGKLDMIIARSMFLYSLPLCLNSIAYWILTSMNRVIINALYGYEANGIYAIGSKFSFFIGLITTCFTYAWQDISFSKSNDEGVGIFYSKASTMYAKVLILCTAIFIPIIKVIFPILVGDSYSSAENIIPLFLIVATVSAVSTFIGNIFYAIKETKMIFISMVISALINVGICYPLILHYHINGANVSILISFIVNIFVRCWVLNKRLGFAISKSVLILIIPLVLSSISFIYLNWAQNFITLFVMLSITLLYFRNYMTVVLAKIGRTI